MAYHINCISNELETIWPSHFANGHEVRGELLPQVQHSHGVFILDGRQTAGLVDLFNFVYLVWQCLASIWIHLPNGSRRGVSANEMRNSGMRCQYPHQLLPMPHVQRHLELLLAMSGNVAG